MNRYNLLAPTTSMAATLTITPHPAISVCVHVKDIVLLVSEPHKPHLHTHTHTRHSFIWNENNTEKIAGLAGRDMYDNHLYRLLYRTYCLIRPFYQCQRHEESVMALQRVSSLSECVMVEVGELFMRLIQGRSYALLLPLCRV